MYIYKYIYLKQKTDGRKPGKNYNGNYRVVGTVKNVRIIPAREGCELVNMADYSELGKAQNCEKNSSNDVGSSEIVPQEAGNNGGEVRY